MKALLQRVASAEVLVEGAPVAAIGPGLLVLLGVEAGDQADDARRLAGKSARLRIFEDEAGRMNRAVGEAGGAVLVVSQFTLVADLRRGNRPSFGRAAPPEAALPLWELFCGELEAAGLAVARGRFGARMAVRLVNDGPVTIWLDSATP